MGINAVEKAKVYVYFTYSSALHKFRTDTEASMNKEFIPGEVLVGGDWVAFTQLSTNHDNIMYSDTKIVAEGFKDEMKYKLPSNRWKEL